MATTQSGIYYQDDYTKSADILADMKEMAESIDGVIEEEKEITEQTIQQIQETQTTQNQKIQELDDNQIHITTEKSSNINVQDASGQNAKINVFGVSKQETRSGKNKFNIDDLINVTDQNAETGSFTASNLYGTTIMNNTNLVNLLKPNTNYKCIANVTLLEEFETATSNIANILNLYKSIAPANSIPVLKCSNATEKNSWQVNETKQLETTFTTDNDLSSYNMLCYCYANDTEAGGKFKFENIMILEATEQDETFEQYGASPSPEFPSEIQNTTGNVKITSCNKNLWNDDSWNIRDVIDGKNVLKFSGYYVSGTGVKNGNPLTFPNKFKKGVTYTVSGKFKKTTYDNQLCIMYKDFSIQYGGKFADNFEKSSVSITTSSEKEVLYFTIFSGSSLSNSYVEEGSLQLEENSIATEYIEHQQQTITFPLQENQKMYKGSETEDDGIHHKRKQIELDGTENWVADNQGGSNTCVGWKILVDDYVGYEGNFAPHGDILCSHFIDRNTYNNELDGISGGWGKGIYIKMKKEDLSSPDLTGFKAFLSEQKTNGTPVTIEYPLAEEEIEAYTEAQQTVRNQLQNAKTYKTVTNVFTNNAEVEMEYVAHTKTYVDNKYNALAEQILEIAGGN